MPVAKMVGMRRVAIMKTLPPCVSHSAIAPHSALPNLNHVRFPEIRDFASILSQLSTASVQWVVVDGVACVEADFSLLTFDPIDGGRHAEVAHEGVGCLLVACRDGVPFLKPGPEPLDLVAVRVDPIRADHGRLVLLGRDRRPRAQVPDVLAEAVAAVAENADERHAG